VKTLAVQISDVIAEIVGNYPGEASYTGGFLVTHGQEAFDAAVGKLAQIGTPEQEALPEPGTGVCLIWRSEDGQVSIKQSVRLSLQLLGCKIQLAAEWAPPDEPGIRIRNEAVRCEAALCEYPPRDWQSSSRYYGNDPVIIRINPAQ
jgi:hypothetical protein